MKRVTTAVARSTRSRVSSTRNFSQVQQQTATTTTDRSANNNFFEKAGRDWEVAWQKSLTPWDLQGTVAPPLVEAFEDKLLLVPGEKALVPGCGSGYECLYLRSVGFQEVVGLDLSKTAIEKAQSSLQQSNLKNIRYYTDDFFAFPKNHPKEKASYDLIFDYLFFAAIDPSERQQWARSMASLLHPTKGILCTLVFPVAGEAEVKNNTNNKEVVPGPPYPVSLEDYQRALKPLHIELAGVDKNIRSVKPRRGREWMAYWRMK